MQLERKIKVYPLAVTIKCEMCIRDRYLYEQKNVDMVNLVLTELDALHQNILEHNIKL